MILHITLLSLCIEGVCAISYIAWVGFVAFVQPFWGYDMVAPVRISMRFYSLLKPTIGFSLNVCTQSLICSMMFQLWWKNPWVFGLFGLCCDHNWGLNSRVIEEIIDHMSI